MVDQIKKPNLSDFQLDEELIKKIEQYNKKQQEKSKKVMLLYSFFFLFSFLFLSYHVSKRFNLAWIGIIIITIVPCFFIVLALQSYIASLFKMTIDPFQQKLTNYKNYQSSLEKYNKYLKNKKIAEEKEMIDRKENQKRLQKEFWFSLSGYKFEREIANILEKLGYKTTLTKGSGDGGVDIVIYDFNNKKIIIQCKAHKNQVGPAVIRELAGTLSHFNADLGILINLGGFTRGVRNFIYGKSLYLMDIEDVINLQQGLNTGKWYFTGVLRKRNDIKGN